MEIYLDADPDSAFEWHAGGPHHINAMQYVALQMMIAKHFGWKVGKFFYFINNLHIYDNQFEQAEELLRRSRQTANRLVLNVDKILSLISKQKILNW